MNAVEIADAVAELAAQPFDAAEFPFAFLKALGVCDTTLKRLRSGNSNASDVPGAHLQKNSVHISVAAPGQAAETFARLKASPRTAKGKCKFVIATDGETVEAEELSTLEYRSFPLDALGRNVGFFCCIDSSRRRGSSWKSRIDSASQCSRASGSWCP